MSTTRTFDVAKQFTLLKLQSCPKVFVELHCTKNLTYFVLTQVIYQMKRSVSQKFCGKLEQILRFVWTK